MLLRAKLYTPMGPVFDRSFTTEVGRAYGFQISPEAVADLAAYQGVHLRIDHLPDVVLPETVDRIGEFTKGTRGRIRRLMELKGVSELEAIELAVSTAWVVAENRQ